MCDTSGGEQQMLAIGRRHGKARLSCLTSLLGARANMTTDVFRHFEDPRSGNDGAAGRAECSRHGADEYMS